MYKYALPGAYVVRKISSAIREGEHKEQPELAPCSLAPGNKREHQTQKRLTAEAMSAPASEPSTEAAVQKFSS
ncbi:hypothetical protein MHYP_G00071190 [Metynnis hypsauchen]